MKQERKWKPLGRSTEDEQHHHPYPMRALGRPTDTKVIIQSIDLNIILLAA